LHYCQELNKYKFGTQLEKIAKTILLVEDEVIIALLEKSWLVSEGYNVIHAHTGESAIDIVNSDEHQIDIILMDIDLGGGMDGTETAKIILQKNDIPILFLTSHNEKDFVEKTEKISSYGYVIKDTTGNVLFASIKMAFKLHEANKELKSKEDALLEGEAKYRLLFENMTTGFVLHQVVYDKNGKPVDYIILDANPAYEKLTGVHIHEIIGKSIREVQPDISQYFLNKYLEVAETGNSVAFSNYLHGLNKYYDTWLFCPKKGQVAAVFSDITNRKLAEEALQTRLIALTRPLESSEDLGFNDLFDLDEIQKIQDAFADATGVASLILDPEGNPITMPSNFCELCKDIIRRTGKGAENCRISDVELGRALDGGPKVQRCLSGGLWDGGTSIQVGDRVIARWLVGQVRDESFDIEKMQDYADVIGADREEFRIALEKVPKMSKERFAVICHALYLIAQQLSNLAAQNVQQARFITEKRKAEQASQLSNEILKQLPDAILLADLNGNITKWMGSAEELLGYSADEIIGKKVSSLYKNTVRDEFEELTEKELKIKGSFTTELPLVKKNGEEMPVEAKINMFYDEIGKPVAIIGINRDIAARKKAEMEISQINTELAELNTTKDKLFSIISHDLKGPFSGFLGITEELKNNLDNLSKEEICNYSSAMHLTAQKMYELLNNLLEWSRMQTGKIEFKPETIVLYNVAQSIINLFSSSAAGKSISIKNNLSESILVKADYYMVSVIIRNLVANAIKFTEAGGEISITGINNGNMVETAVTDNGVGIEVDALDKLFAVDSGYSTKGTNGEEGSGLGLVLCKNMVEKNGGTLSVISSVGKGTTFLFTLPAA